MSTVWEGLVLTIQSLTKVDKTSLFEKLLEDLDFKEALERRIFGKQPEPGAGDRETPSSRISPSVETATTPQERGKRMRERYVTSLQANGVELRQVDRVWAKTNSQQWVAIAFATERVEGRWFLGLLEKEVRERVRLAGGHIILLCESDLSEALDFVVPHEDVQRLLDKLTPSHGQFKFNLQRVGNRYYLKLPGSDQVDISGYKGNLGPLRS